MLVVEDEVKIRDLVRSYLERERLEVLSTASGAEAITLAREAHPDLVVLDLRLPDVPGEEVAREVRSFSSVPIVMLTATSAGAVGPGGGRHRARHPRRGDPPRLRPHLAGPGRGDHQPLRHRPGRRRRAGARPPRPRRGHRPTGRRRPLPGPPAPTTRKKLAAGELESQVLDVLWDAGRPLTPRDVLDALGGRRGLAYTTVMTILSRLWQKGLLERDPHGRAYAYRPSVSRAARAASRMGEVLASAGDRSLALAQFVASLPADQRDELRKALRRSRPAG